MIGRLAISPPYCGVCWRFFRCYTKSLPQNYRWDTLMTESSFRAEEVFGPVLSACVITTSDFAAMVRSAAVTGLAVAVNAARYLISRCGEAS